MDNQTDNNKQKNTVLYYISVFSIVLGTLTWIPNIIFQEAMGFWLFSMPLGLIGLVCATFIKKRILCILSILVTLSFFILMFIGYVIVAIFH